MNRAFEVHPAAAALALGRLAALQGLVLPAGLERELSKPRTWGHIDPIQPLTQELADLVAREIADAARLVGESSWLRTVNDARFLNG